MDDVTVFFEVNAFQNVYINHVSDSTITMLQLVCSEKIIIINIAHVTL